jgi:hypothetical protein
MRDFSSSARQEVVIDLNKLKKTNSLMEEEILNESLESFGADIKIALQRMFGLSAVPVTITGSREDVSAFSSLLRNNYDFIKTVKSFGLDNPKTMLSKAELANAIAAFKRKTGIAWPFGE